MGEFHIGADVVLGGLMAGLLFFIKQKLSKYDKHMDACDPQKFMRFEKHITDCDEIPKKLLIEKIDSVGKRLDETRNDLKAFQEETRRDFKEFQTGVFEVLNHHNH